MINSFVLYTIVNSQIETFVIIGIITLDRITKKRNSFSIIQVIEKRSEKYVKIERNI